MSAYEMLLACGYEPAEASRISGQPMPVRTQPEIAAANEAKYATASLSAEERLMRRLGNATAHGYKVLRGMQGLNGTCTARRGTYRRFKFGNGTFGQAGYERRGFAQNRVTARPVRKEGGVTWRRR